MTPLLVIAPAIFFAARWLKQDAHKRDHDPQSQVRSDWLEFLEDERNGAYEKILNNTRKR